MDERDFGVWLRQELRCRRMSQRQLAERSGVDHSTICRILTDGHTPSLRTAARLARSLGAADLPIGRPAVGDQCPAGRVEHALRSDPSLCEAAVARTMGFYLRERSVAPAEISPGRRAFGPHP